MRQRIHFIANGMYGNNVGGGDVHGYHMAQAALEVGYEARFIGGHALKDYLLKCGFSGEIALTDSHQLPPFDASTVRGQFRLLFDYQRRFYGTFKHLKQIQSQDYVHAVTDYWFDVVPAVLAHGKGKTTLLGMDAPTLQQIIRKSRPDVAAFRLPSLYYWMSQAVSLRLFRCCRRKRMLYVHPTMRTRLLRLGYEKTDIKFGSTGVDVALADSVPVQQKIYDVAWIGRVHRQKGISDLLATLVYLAGTIEGFKALIIGGAQEELAPKLKALNLCNHVEFSGFVAEGEKFRLFKASRVFLMPSHHESWGLVNGEALACGVPVVAYDLPAYRPIFSEFMRYVSCFDLNGFQREAHRQVFKMRQGENYLDKLELAEFKRANSWEVVRERFVQALEELG